MTSGAGAVDASKRVTASVSIVVLLEGDDAFHHHAVEASAALDVGHGIPEVLLVHALCLGQDVGGDEPSAAELPAARAGVLTSRVAREAALRAVEAAADEQALAAAEAVDRVERD